MGIQQSPQPLLSSSNLELNTTLERIHQEFADCLWSGWTCYQWTGWWPVEDYLAESLFLIRCSYDETNGHSLLQLMFARDMFMLVEVEID